MNEKKSIQTKRDLLLITLLFIILGGIYIAFRLFAFNTEASIANVYYGASSDPIVVIDFANNKVIKMYDQDTPEVGNLVYPIIDENQRTITLLGDYTVGGIRQVVVIKYDFGRRSVQVIKESSPNNICSREGESTGWPLICLPNRVRIEFETTDEDFTV
jgi:hypothetical protein